MKAIYDANDSRTNINSGVVCDSCCEDQDGCLTPARAVAMTKSYYWFFTENSDNKDCNSSIVVASLVISVLDNFFVLQRCLSWCFSWIVTNFLLVFFYSDCFIMLGVHMLVVHFSVNKSSFYHLQHALGHDHDIFAWNDFNMHDFCCQMPHFSKEGKKQKYKCRHQPPMLLYHILMLVDP